MSDEVCLMEVIRTKLLTKGNGKNEVFRRVTQYWSINGELLAEVDPYKEEN